MTTSNSSSIALRDASSPTASSALKCISDVRWLSNFLEQACAPLLPSPATGTASTASRASTAGFTASACGVTPVEFSACCEAGVSAPAASAARSTLASGSTSVDCSSVGSGACSEIAPFSAASPRSAAPAASATSASREACASAAEASLTVACSSEAWSSARPAAGTSAACASRSAASLAAERLSSERPLPGTVRGSMGVPPVSSTPLGSWTVLDASAAWRATSSVLCACSAAPAVWAIPGATAAAVSLPCPGDASAALESNPAKLNREGTCAVLPRGRAVPEPVLAVPVSTSDLKDCLDRRRALTDARTSSRPRAGLVSGAATGCMLGRLPIAASQSSYMASRSGPPPSLLASSVCSACSPNVNCSANGVPSGERACLAGLWSSTCSARTACSAPLTSSCCSATSCSARSSSST
mmetsp:Transcript_65153/g.210054  ORF Transcript_65153/g.210054 Transcript_65153/m.210054 type:complete len:415 (+) Transcript_65153:3674-4918(+)